MTPLFVQDDFIICFETENENSNMRHHFIKECGWTEEQFADIEHFAWFSTKVSAWRDGKEWSAEYLGACCYEEPKDFYTKFKDDYFKQMTDDAIANAKTYFIKKQEETSA